MASRVGSVRRGADVVVTVIVAAAVVGWSALYAVLGPLFLRPVSTCAGPAYRCTGAVDLGVAVASWGPMVAAVVMLVAIAWSVQRRRATTPAVVCAGAIVIVLGLVGQTLVSQGVVSR